MWLNCGTAPLWHAGARHLEDLEAPWLWHGRDLPLWTGAAGCLVGHEKLHIRNMIWTTVLGVHCESIQIRSTDRDTDTDNTYVKSWFYGHNFGPWKPHSEFAVFYHLIPSILFLHFVDPNVPACLIASPRMWPLQYPSQKPPIGMHFACLYNTFLISFGMVYHWPKATLLAQEFADLPNKSLWPKAMGDIPVCWWDMRQIGGSWWISRYVSRVLGLLLEKELNDYRKTFFPYLSMLGSLFSLMSLHRADPHPWRQLGEVVSRCESSPIISLHALRGPSRELSQPEARLTTSDILSYPADIHEYIPSGKLT